jgi:uncharacterized protein YegJ (DUF2314 family)
VEVFEPQASMMPADVYPDRRIYMYPLLRWTIIPIFIFLLVACTPSTPTPVPISTFTDPDAELTKAVRQAQDTLNILRRAFLAPDPSYVFMSVKVRFATDEGTEDMWVEPIDILDNVYTVRMVEGVTIELQAHPDRYVEVSPDEIIDWMILKDDGTVLGGYTLRLEYERLSPDEQKKYHERTGYLRFE